MEYGLIGGKLGHSYSKTIHELLCGYSYELCPLPTEADARAFLQRRQFKAINVTIPYKKLVMEYCAFIDPRAPAPPAAASRASAIAGSISSSHRIRHSVAAAIRPLRTTGPHVRPARSTEAARTSAHGETRS